MTQNNSREKVQKAQKSEVKIMDSDKSIVLDAFCGSQEKLAEPFVRDGWRYATDGRVLVRVPSNEPDTEGNPPKANQLFLRQRRKIDPVALAVPEPGGDEDCWDCLGSGVRHAWGVGNVNASAATIMRAGCVPVRGGSGSMVYALRVRGRGTNTLMS